MKRAVMQKKGGARHGDGQVTAGGSIVSDLILVT